MQCFSAPIKDNQFHQQQHTKNLYTHDEFYLRFAQTTAVAVCKCMQIERVWDWIYFDCDYESTRRSKSCVSGYIKLPYVCDFLEFPDLSIDSLYWNAGNGFWFK